MEISDKPCQPAQFRIWKDWLMFPHSSCHGRPGVVPLRPERGGLASAFKPLLRLRQGLPLVLQTVPVVGGSLGVSMTPRVWTTLTCKNISGFSLPRGPLWASFFLTKDPARLKSIRASHCYRCGPHGVLNLQATSRSTIWRFLTSHADLLILGFGKIGSYFRTSVVTAGREQHHLDRRGGALPPRSSPSLGSGKAFP